MEELSGRDGTLILNGHTYVGLSDDEDAFMPPPDVELGIERRGAQGHLFWAGSAEIGGPVIIKLMPTAPSHGFMQTQVQRISDRTAANAWDGTWSVERLGFGLSLEGGRLKVSPFGNTVGKGAAANPEYNLDLRAHPAQLRRRALHGALLMLAPAAVDYSKLKVLAEPEFSLGQMNFIVTKLGSFAGWRITEELRAQFVQLAQTLPPGIGLGFEQALFSLPTTYVDRLRDQMFGTTQFSETGNPPWEKLAGAEDKAFKYLEPFHIYEVLMRAFAVNFLASLDASESLMERLGVALDDEDGSDMTP